jgi:uncharacterized protein
VAARRRQQAGLEVVHLPEESRYEIRDGGERLGFTEYRDRDGRRIFVHTETDPTRAGEGLGTRLIQGALDDTRRSGLAIVARCPFVRAFVKRHPEYAATVPD